MGPAKVLEELRVLQRAGDRRFETIVQLLEDGREVISSALPTPPAARRAVARSLFAGGISSACERSSARALVWPRPSA